MLSSYINVGTLQAPATSATPKGQSHLVLIA